MPTITFSLTDEDVERTAKRLATKLADALKQVVAVSATQAEHPKQQSSSPAEWLTLGDIQRMFQVSRATVYRWTHGEGMPVRRVGGVVRLPADKVREWAEKHSITIPTSDGTTAG
jgi:excisionase family DNA binding protein